MASGKDAKNFAPSDLQPGNLPRAEAALAALCSNLRAAEGRLLSQYVEASPLCVELFAVWESLDSNDNGRIAAMILEVLSAVLEGHFAHGARTAKTRTGVAGRIIGERLQALYRYMNSERDNLLRACLRVLAGVSSQSAAFSSQLVRTFNFGHEGFQKLVGRRSQKEHKSGEKKDVRHWYKSFALSFLRWKEPGLTAAAIGIKGFISPILSGLSQDSSEEILEFLHEISDLIVAHRQVHRNSKLFFFNAYALRNLCNLLLLEDEAVVQRTQDFLVDLCTNTYLFRSQQHQLLLDMCFHLRPLQEPQQNLIAAVLGAHSTLQNQFCARLSLSLQPQMSTQWLLNVRFLVKLLDMDLSKSTATEHANAADHELGVARSWIGYALVPRAIQKTVVTQALMHTHVLVMFSTLQLLFAVLSRTRKVLAGCSGSRRSELENYVQQSMPAPDTLLNIWQQLIKQESDEVDISDFASQAEVEETSLLKLVSTSTGSFKLHSVFQEWCKVVQAYCEVLPRSMSDVKFDWSKLLAAVSAPVLASEDLSSRGSGMLERLAACISCVEAAMRCGGRMQGMQLSKSQISWVDAMLRICSAKCLQPRGGVSSGAEVLAADALAACEAALRGCFRHIGLFFAEEDVEATVWISQLRHRPICISFFCSVLQAVTAKPGAIASQVSSLPLHADEDSVSAASQTRPSLFLIAACKALAQGDKQALQPPADAALLQPGVYVVRCAQCVRGAASQLGMLLLPVAPQITLVIENLGAWCSSLESADDATRQKAEEHRQGLLRELEQTCAPWAFGQREGKSAEKQRADCTALVARTLKQLIDYHLPEVAIQKDGAEPSLGDLRLQIARIAPKTSVCLHSGAYVLLEGAQMCCLKKRHYQFACWYLLMLIDLVPGIAAATSPILEHTLSHPLWLQVVEMASLQDHSHSATFNLLMMLVFELLCRLLNVSLAVNSGKGSLAALQVLCKSVLMRLLQFMPSGSGLLETLDELLNQLQPGADHPKLWADEPLQIACSNLISVLSRAGLLDYFIGNWLSSLEDWKKAVLISSALTGHDVNGHAILPFMELNASRRAQLLHVVVQSALTDDSLRVEGILRKALTMDHESLLHFSMSVTLKELWPKQSRRRILLHSPLLTLLEYACRVNVTLRRNLLRQLNWTSTDPRVVLQLAIWFAALERSLPLLEDESLASVTPKALSPLPPVEHLRDLIVLHPSLALMKLLCRAASEDAKGGSLEARCAVLELQELHGKPADMERELILFIGASNCCATTANAVQSEGRDALQEAHCVCRTLRHLEQHSEKLLERVETYAASLAERHPEAATVVLGRMLSISGAEVPRKSLVRLATSVIENHEGDTAAEWLLRHAVSWAPYFDANAAWHREFVATVCKEYTASLAPMDRLRRHFLIQAADFSTRSDAGMKEQEVWTFQRWCTSLSCWGGAAAWNWVLDSQRVRATADRFWYGRPMVDPAPRACSGDAMARSPAASSTSTPKPLSSEDLQQVYDIGYIAPFIAGQLRANWAENGTDSVDSRRLLAPVLSSIMSGGVLELLLLACACSDESIRACAYESLAVIMAFGSFWNDAISAKARPEEQIKKTRLPFKELPQFMRLLKSTRDALEPPTKEGSPPQALPTLIASFLSACVSVLLQPQHFLYMRIGMFFLGQASLVLADVPLFYKLILFGQAESDRARLWICRVIRRGLYEPQASRSIHRFHSSDGRNGYDSGNRAARVALAHHYVVQWLLSFASSGELGNFAMWSEAVACVEAAFADPANGLQASHRYSIAEWISSQISREWPGLGDRDHRFQALQALTRLVNMLVHHRANSGSGSAVELLSIGGAVEGIARTWASVAKAAGRRQFTDICPQLWLITRRLSQLIASSTVLSDNQCNGPVAAHAAQIGAILQQLLQLCSVTSETSTGDTDALAGIVCSTFGHLTALRHCLDMLKVCPLSIGLQSLAVTYSGHLSNREYGLSLVRCKTHSEHCEAHEEACSLPSNNWPDKQPSLDDVLAAMTELPKSILQVLGRMLAAGQAMGGFAEPLRAGLTSFAHSFAMLPYGPDISWRIQILVCSLILCLQPESSPDTELLMSLPSPEAALASSVQEEGEEQEDVTIGWSASASKLLKRLLIEPHSNS